MSNNPYNLNWVPDLSKYTGSIHIKLLAAMQDDIKSRRLKAGMKLPSQRLLAYTLGVNLGTVHKAYSLAIKQGLISGEIGRGSYVKEQNVSSDNWPNENPYSRLIDFSDNFPCLIKDEKILQEGLSALGESSFLPSLFQYQQNSARQDHKEVACMWLKRINMETTPNNILLTNGALHAGFISLMCLSRPGDLILTEALTSQAIKSAANQMKLRVKGITMDSDGILPEALELLLQKEKVAAIYLVPNLQNPTTSVIPIECRKIIADILAKYNVPLIEDDVFGALLENPLPPISSFIPELSFYATSLSKAIAPALRLGYLSVPQKYVSATLSALRTTSWMASPIMAELASQWIINGTADKLLSAQKKEISQRYKAAITILEDFEIQSHPNALHLWLKLPEPWRATIFEQVLRQKEVAVTPVDHFAIDRGNSLHAVRICLGTPASYLQVKEGLEIIKDTLLHPERV